MQRDPRNSSMAVLDLVRIPDGHLPLAAAQMTAPNWEAGQGLTWSGKWHIIVGNPGTVSDQVRARCGAYVYTSDAVPTRNERLTRIASGEKTAPVCKLCTKSADGPHIVVELIEDTPTPREKFQQDSYMSDKIVDGEYRQYLDRFQPWRWIAKAAGNNEPLARSSENYFNEDDARHAINLLFGSTTPARLTVEYRDGRVTSEVIR